jgi:hypothetical protein
MLSDTQCWLLIVFLGLCGLSLYKKQTEPMMDYNNPNVVGTSGMDTLVPVPFFLKYGYPFYRPQYVPPEWFYDMPSYGPIARPWGPGGRYTLPQRRSF